MQIEGIHVHDCPIYRDNADPFLQNGVLDEYSRILSLLYSRLANATGDIDRQDPHDVFWLL